MKVITTLIGLAAFAVAQTLPPMPAMLPMDDDPTPVLYSTTLAWNAQSDADSFRLICGSNDITLSATNVTIQTPEGTHPLTLRALRHISNGVPPLESEPVVTNLVVEPQRILGVDLMTAATPLGPWVKEPLPPPQTNSTETKFFRLQPWSTNTVRRILQ